MLAPRLRVSSLVSALLLSVPFGAGCGGDDGEPADGGVSAGLDLGSFDGGADGGAADGGLVDLGTSDAGGMDGGGIAPLFPVVDGEIQLPDGPATRALSWLFEQLEATDTSTDAIAARFAPSALAAIPASDWRTFIGQLRTGFARARLVEVVVVTPTQITGLIGRPEEPASGGYLVLGTTYGSEQIVQLGVRPFNLNGSSTQATDQSLDLDGAASRLESLAEVTGVLVARVDAQGACNPLLERASETPFATASIFKIWVMDAVAEAIASGALSATGTLPLRAEDLVAGNSMLNAEPVGSPVSVRDLSVLMLGISDNTATEHLLEAQGRAAMEAALLRLDHRHLDAMQPFLSMNEAFNLYYTVPRADALDYLSASESEQRTYADTVLSSLAPPSDFTRATSEVLVRGTWQASPLDVCRALAGIRARVGETSAFELSNAALGANSALVGLRSRWDRVWFKGGSLADGQGLRVLTLAWLLESAEHGTYVVVTMGNDDSGGAARIDQNRFVSVTSRVVDLVGEMR